MSITLKTLRDAAAVFCPELAAIIEHDSEITQSTWLTSLQTGKAIEMLSLCALASSAKNLGANIHVPYLFVNKPDLYYVRNVIPRHHGAQPGHEATIENLLLEDRFVAAMTPRLLVEIGSRVYGVYREGFPIHLIHTLRNKKAEYFDRPDILIVEGSVAAILESSDKVNFTYACSLGKCNGTLRVKNDISLPIISYNSDLLGVLPIKGIIECSVGKGNYHAEKQLNRYLEIFSGSDIPLSLLVNGRNKRCDSYDFESCVDMASTSIDDFCSMLSGTMDSYASKLFN
ncbi:hypothetical protein F6V25_08220 [Oryzomonas japonica]|uniref:Uncharacterized protein n=1 Tax=Oryzomonas japonica TaxID=2603858 RepID=A0A7J4ZRU6_9BACT|nr:hypothetical protein [Oryzomonas japonica]KAB0665695.1 hypothetical protein F6V25_08220 [Oryzomonas japonica]